MTKYEHILSPRADSYAITFACLDAFEEMIAKREKEKNLSCDDLFTEMHDLARLAIKSEPNKALIRRTLTSLLNHCKRILKSDRKPQDILTTIKERVRLERHALEENASKIAAMASKAIAQSNSVLTMSNDYLIAKTLLDAEAQKRHYDLYVLKSNPLGIGAEFAEKMADHGLKVTVVDDSQMGVVLPKINLLFLGADRLYETGFIHRAGSLPLCLTAKYFSVPVYLIVDTRAILFERERSVKFYTYPGEEIYKPQNPAIKVLNVYQESIPYNLIYKVVCEFGIFEMNEFINWYLLE